MAGGELVDQVPVDAGCDVVVEVGQGGRGGQAGEPEPAGQAAGLGGGHLDLQEMFQGCGQRQSFGGRGVQDGGEVFGGVVQLEDGEVLRSCW